MNIRRIRETWALWEQRVHLPRHSGAITAVLQAPTFATMPLMVSKYLSASAQHAVMLVISTYCRNAASLHSEAATLQAAAKGRQSWPCLAV